MNGMPCLISGYPDHPDVRTCRCILELEALGAEVLVAPADIADAMQIREVLESILLRFGVLHGIIMTAGNVLKVA